MATKRNTHRITGLVVPQKAVSKKTIVAGRKVDIFIQESPLKGFRKRKRSKKSPRDAISVAEAAINALKPQDRLEVALSVLNERDGTGHGINDAIESLTSKYETIKAGEVGQILYPNASQSRGRVQSLRENDQLLGFQIGSHYHFPVFQFDLEKNCIKELVVYANKKLKVSKDPYGALSWWETPVRMARGVTPLQLLVKGELTQKFIDNVFASYRAGM